MKYLLIYAHPNPKSFNNAIKEKVLSTLKNKGHEVIVRDLYELNIKSTLDGKDFNDFFSGNIPSDIKTEQEYISNCDHIIIVHPVWWFNFPAILKGYIDRVFSMNFAYSMNMETFEIKGLLKDKKVSIFSTTGGGKEDYESMGINKALNLTIDSGIFNFCAIEVANHEFFYAVPKITNEERIAMLNKISTILE